MPALAAGRDQGAGSQGVAGGAIGIIDKADPQRIALGYGPASVLIPAGNIERETVLRIGYTGEPNRRLPAQADRLDLELLCELPTGSCGHGWQL